ncbi:putative 50 kda protein in type i retrotransposable element r1dm [Lasius niger]|uniref:Putative 50 kDa protein in type i retrotransposable element r1dm n=1 Tax=Lasius niger TaxID=67767 RepID=A0A0J7KH84_LASNI|nr:putative 50 kda protein in type i retrotransposable element r1dm [Lasius niger]
MEVSAVLINLLDERSTAANLSAGDVRKAVAEVFDDLGGRCISGSETSNVGSRGGFPNVVGRSYASVAGFSGSEVRVSRGPTVEISNTTSFLVVPKENAKDKFVSSQVTRKTLYKVLKPADCGLRVKRLSRARDSGVRIKAFSPDIEKFRAHPGLASAGLEVRENTKRNPRLIVHSVPADMSAEEIRDELIAQNLSGESEKELRTSTFFA